MQAGGRKNLQPVSGKSDKERLGLKIVSLSGYLQKSTTAVAKYLKKHAELKSIFSKLYLAESGALPFCLSHFMTESEHPTCFHHLPTYQLA